MLEAAEHHRQHRQPLADIVVQIARDARPFRFLRGNQPAGEILILADALSKRPLALAQRIFDPSASDALNHQPGNQRGLQPEQLVTPRM